MSTKNNKLIFLAAMAFYGIVGITACGFLFAKGSSLQITSTAAIESPYDIKPELLASPIPEETPEPVPEEDPVQEDSAQEADHYYLYEVIPVTALNVREAPDVQSEIIFNIMTGTTGIVLEKGEEWSHIQTPQGEGYSSNRYLTFTEVSREEYLSYPD